MYGSLQVSYFDGGHAAFPANTLFIVDVKRLAVVYQHLILP